MRISRVKIKNYRNLKNVDVKLGSSVVLVGENNSGKSNFLRAITLPLLADEIGYTGKNLSSLDFNKEAKNEFMSFIERHYEDIKNGTIEQEEFISNIPVITVELTFTAPNEDEMYFVRDFASGIQNGEIVYSLKYDFHPTDYQKIMEIIKNVLKTIGPTDIKKYPRSVFPVEEYEYSITTQDDKPVTNEDMKRFLYTRLEAERDDFARARAGFGYKPLTKLLQTNLGADAKITLEKQYTEFFDDLKTISKMEQVLNWQESSEIEEAKNFIKQINVLPNMPQMDTIVNSVRLGYGDEEMSTQGLGYRNLILLLVLINSLATKSGKILIDALTIEEPEAHLCLNNIHLLVSFLNAFIAKNNFIQLFFSTHSTEFINKIGLENVIVLHNGVAYSLASNLSDKERNYLSKTPNLDIFKFLFSKQTIFVEGISEELLIRAYLSYKNKMNEISVFSFHKGFTKIIEIWKKLNVNQNNKLAVIRDYDNQDNAKEQHENLTEEGRVFITTTKEYTLEPEIVKTDGNYDLLKKMYGDKYNWSNVSQEELIEDWKKSKADIMFTICCDLSAGKLEGFKMPQHVQNVLDFMLNVESSNTDEV